MEPTTYRVFLERYADLSEDQFLAQVTLEYLVVPEETLGLQPGVRIDTVAMTKAELAKTQDDALWAASAATQRVEGGEQGGAGGWLDQGLDAHQLLPLVPTGQAHAFDMFAIGRARNNDLVLPRPQVSKFHAYLRRRPDGSGRWELTDADSTNGTWLGKRRLEPRAAQVLPPGQVVWIGQVPLELVDPKELYARLQRFALVRRYFNP